MVIAPKDFRDEEFFDPKKIFEDNGADVTAASLSTQPAEGMMGAKVKPDIAVDDVDTKDYDAVVLVGGTGAQKHLWDNEKVRDICKTAYDAKKIVGAICLAPVVLARAGLLKKKDATVFDSKDAIKELKANNANYIKKRTVISENIITGNGPAAAKDFGAKIVKMLGK
ncbi:MAG: hypothetical protein A7316_03735 [Candidatus Altiarchaeales archaeon WOR_SM1_86-2]|nr:MAG: hypothetical protein A7316_03735 [Candidatus Altiarchaeales archaeon WOR_SM1_86-2]